MNTSKENRKNHENTLFSAVFDCDYDGKQGNSVLDCIDRLDESIRHHKATVEFISDMLMSCKENIQIRDAVLQGFFFMFERDVRLIQYASDALYKKIQKVKGGAS